MSSLNTGDTVVNGVRLHYTRTGGKKPPVVLAHGFSDAGLCWTPVAQALEANYDLVMVDARGHGFSDAPATGYTLTEMASDLMKFDNQDR
jgi:N-formylmaleamate deformylase